MTYPTCRSCLWWNLESRDAHTPNLHQCASPKIGVEHPAADEVLLTDGLGFWTGQDFGCIHHLPIDSHADATKGEA